MKQLYIIIIFVLYSIVVNARHPHMHIYRNDHNFNSIKISEIDSILFQSPSWGDTSEAMRILTFDSQEKSIPAAAIDSIVFGQNVPTIKISLLDFPDIEDIFKTGGFDKNTIYRATVEMDGNGHFEDLEPTEVEFRGRGNSTWKMPKTPYRFKFAKKKSLCGLEKAKTYVLIANYIDCTLMRNVTAYSTARSFGMPFTNHTVPVNVYLNGNYRGAYFLTEKLGIGSASVDIDETNGMLFELDANFDEDFKFKYPIVDGNEFTFLPVMVKDPDLSELAEDNPDLDIDDYFRRWRNDMYRMLRAVITRAPDQTLADVIDVQSAADFLTVNLICYNWELNHPQSCFLWKRALGNEEKYHFGPVWDFDWGFTYNGREGGVDYDFVMLSGNGKAGGYSFFIHLAKNQEIRKAIDLRFEQFRTEIWPALKEELGQYADYIEPSAKANGVIWGDDPTRHSLSSFDFRKNYNDMIEFLEKRIEWLRTDPNRGLY